MIIRMMTIYWVVTGKLEPDDKFLLNIAKSKGYKVSDSFRKNLANALSGNNYPTETTKTVLNITVNEWFEHKIKVDLWEKIDVSTPELAYERHEQMYKEYFQCSGFDKTFLALEVKKTFLGFRKLHQSVLKGASEDELRHKLAHCELLPRINYDDTLTLAIESKDVSHEFSLDWLLYFLACMEADRCFSYCQLTFDAFNHDLKAVDGNLKPPFAYYLALLKEPREGVCVPLTDQQAADELGIELRHLSFYKKGAREPSKKLKNWMLKEGHFIYFIIKFWVNLINKFTVDDKVKMIIMAKISEYPKFLEIAKAEYNKAD